MGLFCLTIAIGFGLAAGGNALLLTKVRQTKNINYKLIIQFFFYRFTQSTEAVVQAWTKEFKNSSVNSSVIKQSSRRALILQEAQSSRN
jgi:hypothetical protein